MDDCVQLDLDALEQAAGGAFQFYSNGTKCKVGGRTYTCSSSAQRQVINLINTNLGMSEAEILSLAVSKGILNPL